MILSDFYSKHSGNVVSHNPNLSQNRNLSPDSASRSPSNRRSISPTNSINNNNIGSSSIKNKGISNNLRTGTNNFSMINKQTGNIIKSNFSKSTI